MDIISLAAVILSLSAAFAWLNLRFIGLPTTIGVMLIALVASLALIVLGWLGVGALRDDAAALLGSVDFDRTLMDGMLSFLLFAGALHVDLDRLAEVRRSVALLASVGVLISTAVVGTLSWLLLAALGLPVAYLYCLLFGALISPTDPIAVMATLKKAGIAPRLETKIAGESLFNDGFGVVVFVVLLGIVTGGDGEVSLPHAAWVLLTEAGGGALFGVALGTLGFHLLRSVDDYQVEILVTLALVMGGYALAHAIHTSAPIAVVVAGLIIGNRARRDAMSDTTRLRLDNFWELLDEILNVVLFVLIGLEVLVLELRGAYLAAGVCAIPLVLLARLVSVGAPISLLRLVAPSGNAVGDHAVKILVWGGLKGGISVALALSLPAGGERDIFLVMTYVVVIFSITVQGLTIAPFAKRLSRG